MNQRRAALGASVAMFAAAVVGIGVIAGGGDTLPKLQVGGAGGGDAAAMSAGRSESGAEPATSDMAYGGGVEYRVQGELPDLGDKAAAYDISGGPTRDEVAALAERLAIEGPVETEGEYAYVVTDGVQQLRVDRFAGGQWYFGPYFAPDCAVSSTPVDGGMTEDEAKAREIDCAQGSGSGSGSSGGSGGVSSSDPGQTEPAPPPAEACPMPDCPPDSMCTQACPTPRDGEKPVSEPMPMPEPERPADLPSKADAQAIAQRWFDDLGIEYDVVHVFDGFSEWHVSAEAVIGGLPVVGLGSTVNVGPKGEIRSGSGFLGVAEALGDYPLVSTADGVERLRSNFPYGNGGHSTLDARPMIAVDCPPEAMCDPMPTEPVVRTIVGARLGLLWQGPMIEGGAAQLLPAFLFEIAEDSVEGPPVYQPVIAVTDEHVEIPEQTPTMDSDGGTDMGRPEPAVDPEADPAVSGPAEE